MLVSAASEEPSQGWVTIPAGEEGEATLTVEPRGFGDWSKTYTVETDDPDHPKVYLTLAAEIRPRIHVEPRLLDLGTVSPATDTTLTATLRPVEPEGFEILRIELDSGPGERGRGGPPGRRNSPVSMRHYRDENQAEPTWRLELRLAPGAATGEINEKVIVSTTDPYLPELELRLAGRVEVGIAHPRLLEMISPYPGAIQTGELRLVRVHGPAFEVLGITLTHPQIQAELKPVTDGEEYRIVVTVPPETPEGLHTPWLLIRTDRPDLPLLRVKIRAIVE